MTHSQKVFTRRRLAIIAGTFLYSSGFYLLYVLQGNAEFLLYMAEFFAFIALACLLLRRVPDFPDYLLILLSFVGLLHVMGGGLYVGDGKLYETPLLELYQHIDHPELFMLRYDQLIHAFGFGTAALGFRWLCARFASSVAPLARNTLAVLAALGAGALNELSEFSATFLFDRTGVGGYYNVGLDLFFNFSGALLFVVAAELFAYLKARKAALRRARVPVSGAKVYPVR